ncbi:MAG: DivIVA domain-containing protein [Actinomycetota bacterium]
MALSPEDVINKRFQPTKFREGYDQDEVDDFLDEIVVELRRLNQENTDLKQRLEAAGQTVAPADSTPSPVSEPLVPAAEGAGAVQDPSPADGVAAAEPAAPVPGATHSAAGVLAMAQKLHDEYVAEGSAERDRIVAEARSRAEELVEDARRTREETLTALRDEEAELQHRVTGLRSFERDYRAGLRDFIQEQLQDLDTAPSLEPARAADGAAAASAAERS